MLRPGSLAPPLAWLLAGGLGVMDLLEFAGAVGGCTRGLALLWGESHAVCGVGGTRPPRLSPPGKRERGQVCRNATIVFFRGPGELQGQNPAVLAFKRGGGVELIRRSAEIALAAILSRCGVFLGVPLPVNTEKNQKPHAGRFRPGVSGNPKGKPKGSRHRSTLIAEQLIDGASEAILSKCVELAKAGDAVALRLCVERLVPRRSSVVALDLPAIARAADVAAGFSAILAAAASGQISLGEAKEFMALVDGARRAFEVSELSARLSALEALETGIVAVRPLPLLLEHEPIRPDPSALAQLRLALDRRRDEERR